MDSYDKINVKTVKSTEVVVYLHTFMTYFD